MSYMPPMCPGCAALIAKNERLQDALKHHLSAKTDPCQDRGVDWPCDVAEAFGFPKEMLT